MTDNEDDFLIILTFVVVLWLWLLFVDDNCCYYDCDDNYDDSYDYDYDDGVDVKAWLWRSTHLVLSFFAYYLEWGWKICGGWGKRALDGV